LENPATGHSARTGIKVHTPRNKMSSKEF